MVEIAPGIDAIPGKLGGKPCIKGTRIPVWMILEWLEEGKTIEEIVVAFEGIKREDVTAVIRFAKSVILGEIILETSA